MASLTDGDYVLIFHPIFLNQNQPAIMKKLFLFILFLATIVVFEFCSGSKKAQKTAPVVSYATNVQPVVMANCSPCHVGSNAKQKKLDSYDAVKNNISEIVRRVQLNPGDKDFMPMRHPKLPDSTIQVLLKWRNDGLMQ